MGKRTTAGRLVLLGLVCAVVVVASSLLGPTHIYWFEIFPFGASNDEPGAINVFWTLRVPRTVLAALAGAGLALGGVILQALFRNPLATPFTFGIASGASLGAALAAVLHLERWIPFFSTTPLFAFVGALVAMSLVYSMARLRAGRDMMRLLLAGVCISYMSAAGVMLVMFLVEASVTNRIVIWMMGSLSAYRPRAGIEIAIVLLPVLGFVVYSHRTLDLLSMGEHLAASRGAAVSKTIWISFLLVGVLTAVIVSNCGPIGFVGLMVPHITRTLFGLRTLPLVIGSVLIGAAFLALCDGFARSIPGVALPVGVLTNLLGGAFFFYLLATRDVGFGSDR